jgi:hypothetical protein
LLPQSPLARCGSNWHGAFAVKPLQALQFPVSARQVPEHHGNGSLQGEGNGPPWPLLTRQRSQVIGLRVADPWAQGGTHAPPHVSVPLAGARTTMGPSPARTPGLSCSGIGRSRPRRRRNSRSFAVLGTDNNHSPRDTVHALCCRHRSDRSGKTRCSNPRFRCRRRVNRRSSAGECRRQQRTVLRCHSRYRQAALCSRKSRYYR